MESVALFFHLLGAFLFVAGVVLAGVAFEAARRRETPGEIALLLGLARAAVAFVGIGALLAGVFGLWLVHLGHWGYGSDWVSASIALYVVAMALGGFGGRTPRRARVLATRLAAEGAPLSGELRSLLDDVPARVANYGALAALIAIVALMVFK
jgi:uncharacterized membrane protein